MTADTNFFNSSMTSMDYQSRQALAMYNDLCLQARVRRFIAWITGRRARKLDDLTSLADRSSAQGAYAGLKVVDIDQIHGSEGRTEDFDAEFRPLRETTRDRWVRIARAFMRGEALPPVELIQVDDVYYVRDGHHRISVAKSLGMHYIDAEITRLQITHTPL